MLLTEITLNDFRQFKGKHTIEFSVDEEKNVTVIIGENGSGKTTLAQAFTWCLYGETDFKNKSVLNIEKSQEMQITDETTVYVELKIIHNGIEYTIVRSQGYGKDRTGAIKSQPTRLVIHYKDSSGQIQTVRENQTQLKIKEILPKELSRYFFFDGERVEKMSSEIQSGKSPEFAEAVKRLLGLNSYVAALRHLGGDKRAGKNSSVIGSYNSAYDSSNDSKMQQYTSVINSLQEQLMNLNSRREDIERTLPIINSEIDRLTEIIAQNRDGETLQRDANRKRDEIRRNDAVIDSATEKILTAFKKNYRFFFYKKIVGDALEVLQDADKVDKGVPDIHERTINFLFNRGFCICGNPICDGSKERQVLEELLSYIPPQSLGTMISAFAKESKHRTEVDNDIYSIVSDILKDVEERRQSNEGLLSEIKDIEDRIKTYESIGQYQAEVTTYRNDRQKKQSELSEISSKIGRLETERERQETERKRLALQSTTNKKVAIYSTYAQRIYDILSEDYGKREKSVRKKLEAAINDIFLTIYNGGLSLKIDSKYNVQTLISDSSSYNGIMDDTSTAQSISIIFAFIAGVIKVAREADEDSNNFLSAEAYPLVMDAPLSAFDKRRIQTVCETLPKIAEQVIIFIKDTDGEIAEKYLSEKIGSSYEFVKKSETETSFKERR